MIGLHRNWSAENMEPKIPKKKNQKIILIKLLFLMVGKVFTDLEIKQIYQDGIQYTRHQMFFSKIILT